MPGLRREEWTGAAYSDDEFRELAEIEPGVPFFGTGGLGERIWTGPAVTVTGIDVLPVDKAVNAVVPYARAKVSLRVHPDLRAAARRVLGAQDWPRAVPVTVVMFFLSPRVGACRCGSARGCSWAPGR